MDKQGIITSNLRAALLVKEKMLNDSPFQQDIAKAVDVIVDCFRKGGKVLFCGNGGSAADAQHLAAELSGRYYYDRPPLFAEALHVNTSYLTAVSNDYSFDISYLRLVKAFVSRGDVLVSLSTSGNSKNIVNAVREANAMGAYTIGLTGEGGGQLAGLCQMVFKVPSDDTPRIQEGQMFVGHTICEMVERIIFPQ
ncbi:phosphoheptose isomerase [Mangrovibacterium marinum]|uniref:Phosphoheptose isomerase n=1 Tax=Mangrovibacterium marinum TaxID=1639118 RepID=A0A2T5C6B7_9BACT|nr:SIS domain-containing protein [Mangrovibacterium marinum]PTN10491.1 phosphoheptose isomerase [Mangrovibacterium marinum]